METADKLKRILADWNESDVPDLFDRDFNLPLVGGSEILCLIGARRSGKTCLCHQLVRTLLQDNPKSNVIYLNCEDERLHPLRGDELSLLWETILEVFQSDTKRKIYLLIDEIQNIPNWSKWARRITEQNRNLKLILTGSSSKLLSREIATELRGRTLVWNVYPLNFQEFLRARKIETMLKRPLQTQERASFKRQFQHYLKLGGFPGILNSPAPNQVLSEYFKVMFYRDIVERHKVSNIKLLEDFLNLLMDQMACDFSISSTAKKLNQFGYTFSKNTLSNFLNYAEEAFLIFTVKKYSYKIKEQMRAPRKVYNIDHGLTQAVRFGFSENAGRVLENIAYLAIKRTGCDIYYHKAAKECDFVVTDRGRPIQAIQVTRSIGSPETRKREVEGLAEALSAYNIKNGIILTEDLQETIHTDRYEIQAIPLWLWLLSNDFRPKIF